MIDKNIKLKQKKNRKVKENDWGNGYGNYVRYLQTQQCLLYA